MTIKEKGGLLLMGAGRAHRLPPEYQEVAWIKSSGSQYIDTMALASNLTKISLEFRLTKFYTSGAHHMLGTARNVGTGSITYQPSGSTSVVSRFGFQSKTAVKNIWDTNKHTAIISNSGYVIDGTNYWTPNSSQFTADGSLYIFAANGGSGKIEDCEISYFRIEEDDALVRDYIPCYRKSDVIIGLYDLCGSICPLTGTPFYINAGTGTFTKGADVL